MKTYSAKPGEIERHWFVVDATDQVLGRLATRVATVLRGKHKPVYTPHTDVGDFVIVTNAEKVKLSGQKLDQKMYRRHSNYPGGLREVPYRRLLETYPERAIEQAVKGMLPHTSLGRRQLAKLKVYRGANHPHTSQKPDALELDGAIPVHAGPSRDRPKPAADAASKAAAKPSSKPKAAARTSKPKAKATAKAKVKAKAKPSAKAKAKPSTKAKAKPKAKPKAEAKAAPRAKATESAKQPTDSAKKEGE